MIARRVAGFMDIRPTFETKHPGDWQEQALCAQVGMDEFFPEKGGSTRMPKLVCERCPVRAACLVDAMSRDDRYGVWGGLSERERRRLRDSGWRPGDPVPPVRIPHRDAA